MIYKSTQSIFSVQGKVKLVGNQLQGHTFFPAGETKIIVKI